MNESYLIAAGTAVWLGILTSISPCPLTTNITAISFIGRKFDRPGYVLYSGLLYTLGRTLTYIALGYLILASTMGIPDLSFFLQKNINKILGPLLFITGLFLVGIIKFNPSGIGFGQKFQGRIEKLGLSGALVLGILFALSFCPVSAALFFGSLIPIALERQSSIIIPALYGFGTALPVVAFSVFIALGTRFVALAFDKLGAFEKWARRITGIIFILAGIYLIWIYILGWPSPI